MIASLDVDLDGIITENSSFSLGDVFVFEWPLPYW